MTGATQEPQAGEPYCLAHALAYAAHGWPVFPLAQAAAPVKGKDGKAPAVEMVPHGFRDATTDPAVIRRWFEKAPGAGVGICPGPAWLLVLDVDVKRGATGLQDLGRLQSMHGTLPPTLTQRTPSGGHHLFFGLAEPGVFSNATIKDAPGIDIRCAGGYVAAEPTRAMTEPGKLRAYAFDDWEVLDGELPEIAQAPAWLLDLLAKPKAPAVARPAAGAPSPREHADARTVGELRSALNAINPDDYAAWIANGQRLRGLGEAGRELWLTWSQQSAKWHPGDAQRWHGFSADHAGYRGVFKAAQAAGWVNPAGKVAALPVTTSGEVQSKAAAPPAPAWKLVPIEDLDHAELPPQQWLWDGYIPAGEVTLLAAHGGAGKSTIALMLGVCTVLGLPMFGVPTQAAPVVFYSAEDDSEAVRRALERVIRHLGVSAADLAGRLLVIDATHCAPELVASTWQNDGEGGGRPAFGLTKLGADLRDLVQGADSPPLLIVDNASDTFGGNENARPEVRAFVRQLAGMVRVSGGAALLLAHLDKNSARGLGGGESYSGSTAWHNSVRSRLFLGEDKGGGLVLEHLKSNRGRKREPVHLVWPVGGLPQVDAPASGFVGAIAANNNTAAVLRLVYEFTQREEWVSTETTSRTHAGKLLRLASGFPHRLTDPALFELLRNAERRGQLERVKFKGSNRHTRERWGVTAAGCEAAGIDLASGALTSRRLQVSAPGAESSGGCADCADFALGGVGENARAELGAELT